VVAKLLVPAAGGGLDSLPSLQAGRWGAQADGWPGLGLALTSIVICYDLSLILTLLTCFLLLNASFLRKEVGKLVKWILVSFVH